jgi:hypothetical protein
VPALAKVAKKGVGMAGDWIKMRYSLATDPKVKAIARHISASPHFSMWATYSQSSDVTLCDALLRNAVIGALHNVWCAANEHAANGRIDGADLEWVDGVCGIENMGEAMRRVGWVSVDEAGIVFPKFDSNNTSAAERQKRYREKRASQRDVTGDVTRCATVAPREEKRREEKNTKGVNPLKPPATGAKPVEVSQVSIPPELDTEAVRQSLADWLAHHKATRKPYRDPKAVARLFEPYVRAGPAAFIAAVNASIANNYQGLYPPKESNAKQPGPGQRHDPTAASRDPRIGTF